MDLMVIYRASQRFMDRLKELYLAWNIPGAVDILAYTPDEFDRMMKESAFLQDTIKEARTLYERS